MTQSQGFPRDAPGQSLLMPSGARGLLTYGMRCGRPSRTRPFPAGHRPGRTPGVLCKGTAAPPHMCTESSHTGPQKARGAPGGGSGQTPKQSSEAGTAPTGPAGMKRHFSAEQHAAALAS